MQLVEMREACCGGSRAGAAKLGGVAEVLVDLPASQESIPA